MQFSNYFKHFNKYYKVYFNTQNKHYKNYADIYTQRCWKGMLYKLNNAK